MEVFCQRAIMIKFYSAHKFYRPQLLLVVAIVSFAYFLEGYQALAPCSLCTAERFLFAVLGLFYLLGSFITLKRLGEVLLNGGVIVIAALGLLLAGRQIWLQYFPPTVSGNCDANWYYLFQIMPWKDVLLGILMGGVECAKVTWRFLSLNLAQWAWLGFLGFLGLAILRLYQLLLKHQ